MTPPPISLKSADGKWKTGHIGLTSHQSDFAHSLNTLKEQSKAKAQLLWVSDVFCSCVWFSPLWTSIIGLERLKKTASHVCFICNVWDSSFGLTIKSFSGVFSKLETSRRNMFVLSPDCDCTFYCWMALLLPVVPSFCANRGWEWKRSRRSGGKMRNQLGLLEGIIMHSHPLCGGRPVTLLQNQYKSKRCVCGCVSLCIWAHTPLHAAAERKCESLPFIYSHLSPPAWHQFKDIWLASSQRWPTNLDSDVGMSQLVFSLFRNRG